MRTLKLFFFLLFVSGISCAGEPGTDETFDSKKLEKKELIEKEIKNEKKQEILVNTSIQVPKNPIDKIFLQTFGKPIDPRYSTLLKPCLPAKINHSCKSVRPKKTSSHFNRYYYYLNSKGGVYGVIAFSDQRIGNVEHCRSLIKEWKNYFNHFDFKIKTEEKNLDQLILVTEGIKKSDVYLSCYPESYRDVKSYFSLKLFVHEN